jgi:PKD repeat protein
MSFRGSFVYGAALLLFMGAAGCSDTECPADDCSCHIAPTECLAAQCNNGRPDGDETGVDCGGSCRPCALAAECYRDRDCASGHCLERVCVEAEPDAGGSGGSDSSGVGGSSGTGGSAGAAGSAGTGNDPNVPACVAACPIGAACTTAIACATGFCTAGVCASEGDVAPPCETACAVGTPCTVVQNCQSGVCSDGVCGAAASCGDSVLNGSETDIDCGGGACAGCERGSPCQTNTDCRSAHCLGLACVTGPTAGFTLDISIGPPPLAVTVTPVMSEGDAAITSAEYRFGDGDDFAAAPQHTYSTPGTFTITQRVVDANGFTATTTHVVRVTSGGFTPVLLNESDHSGLDYDEHPRLLLTDDRLGVEIFDSGLAGVRSDQAVFPGTGLFYFEGERTTDELFDSYIGVATSNADLNDPGGSTSQSLVASSEGRVNYNGTEQATFDGANSARYGFIVDYRGANPLVYVVTNDGGTGQLTATVPMTGVTQPLFIFVGGRRRTVGVQARINPGNDTANFPFTYDPGAVLNANSVDPSALVLGWGQTHAEPPSAPPDLSAPPGGTVALGGSLALSATATDTEDGSLDASIHWVDLATPRNDPGNTYDNVGATWQFTPTALGIHPIEVSVIDSAGLVARQTFDVEVTGTLPVVPVAQVRLEQDAQSSSGADLRGDGRAAAWNDNGKYGVRANQGMIGNFWYFELHRLGPPQNQGGGLMIKDGHLDPYKPLNVAPSCSFNYSASIWRDLISVSGYETDDTDFYGLAVDYRGRNPIVHFITQDGSTPVLAHTMVLPDVTVPVYPILYGNPQDNPGFDAEINFGATSFHYNPAAVLSGGGVDPSGLQVGWGQL